MAQAKYTVFFEVQKSGLTPADWAEKEVIVEGKEKSKAWLEGTGNLTQKPVKCTAVTIVAESNAEAVKAVRKFYGQGIANDKFLVGLTSNLEELTPIP